MKSVKGLTWGTPEFTAIAKAAEREGEAEYAISEMRTYLDVVSENTYESISIDSMRKLRRISNDIDEVIE